MPLPYVTEYDATEIRGVYEGAGLSGENLNNRIANSLRTLNRQRSDQYRSQMNPLESGWDWLKRIYRGVGSLSTSMIGSIFGYGDPGQVIEEIFDPSKTISSGVLPSAPGAAQLLLPLLGTLPRDLLLLKGAGSVIGGLGPIKAAASIAARPTRVLQTGLTFGALSPLQERSFADAFTSGVALGAGPAILSKFTKFAPKFLTSSPELMASAGLSTKLGEKSLSAIPRLGAIGGSSVFGLTAKDYLRGQSLAEQFDPRTDEGIQSIIDKALAFGFTTTGAAKVARKMKSGYIKADRAKLAAAEKHFKEVRAPEEARMLRQKIYEEAALDPQKALLLQSRYDDRALEKVVQGMKIKIPKEFYEPEEVTLRKFHQAPGGDISREGSATGFLDVADPARPIFKEFARDILAAKMQARLGQGATVGELSVPFEKAKRIGEALYLLREVEFNKKMPRPLLDTPTNEGILREPSRLLKPGKLFLRPVTKNPVTGDQRAAVGKLRGMIRTDLKDLFPGINERAIDWTAIYRTLNEMMGKEKADFLVKSLSKRLTYEKAEGRISLADYLTGEQYKQFTDIYKGQMHQVVKSLQYAKSAVNKTYVNVEPFVRRYLEEAPPDTLKVASRSASDAGIMSKWRSSSQLIGAWSDKNPGTDIMEAWINMTTSDTKFRDAQGQHKAMVRWASTDGFGAHPMWGNKKWEPGRNALVQLMSPKSAKKMGIKWGPKSNQEAAQAVRDAGVFKGSDADFMKLMNKTAKRFRTIYNSDFARLGMSYDRFLEDYLPHIIEWQSGGFKEPIASFLAAKGVAKADAENVSQILTQLAMPVERRLPAYKDVKGFELPRLATAKEGAKELLIEKNPLVAIEKYGAFVARRVHKDPVLPFLNEVTKQLQEATAENPSRGIRIRQRFADVVKAWYGVPTSADQYAKGAHPFIEGWNWASKHLFRGIVPEVTPKNSKDIRSLFDFITTASYGITLGYTPWPVLKNVTQSSHNFTIFGGKRSISNLIRYRRDPEHKARVEKLRIAIRPQFLDMNPEAVGKLNELAKKFTTTGLIPFKMADGLNVIGAISNSIDAFDKAMSAVGKDFSPENKNLFLEHLLLGKNVRTGKIWDRFRGLPGAKEFRTTWRGSKSIGDVVWNLAKAGQTGKALEGYAKFMTYLGQYAYGGMEGPAIFRGSLNRMVLQYMSWPANYMEFLTSLAEVGPGREWLRQAAIWGGFLGLARLSGGRFHKWFGAGALPADMALRSVPVQAARHVYKIGRGTAMASQGWLAGQEDDWYLMNYQDRMMNELEGLGDLIPFRNLSRTLYPDDEG